MPKRLVFLVFTILVGGAIVFLNREGVDGDRLSNGWKIQLLASHIGGMSFSSEPEIKGLVRNLGPEWISSQMKRPLEVTFHPPGEGTELNLLMRYWPADSNVAEQSVPPLLEIVDPDGFDPLNRHQGSIMTLLDPSGFVVIYSLRMFPRRQPQLHLRLRDVTTDQVLDEMSLANPGYQNLDEEWTPQPLPNTQTVGNTSLTLEAIGVDPQERRLVAQISGAVGMTAEEGPRMQIDFCDSTGNQGDWLSPFEPAWKVRATYWRPPQAAFLAEEKWSPLPVPLPAAGELTVIRKSAEIDQTVVTLLGILSPGQYLVKNGQMERQATPFATPVSEVEPNNLRVIHNGQTANIEIDTNVFGLLIQHAKLDMFHELLVRVHDLSTQNLRPEPAIHQHVEFEGTTYLWVPLQVEVDSTTCQIEIVVHGPLEFEFVVKPPVVVSNDRE